MSTTAPKHLSAYLYESRSVILEMLEQRGFQVDKYKNFTSAEMNLLASEIKTQTPEPIVSTNFDSKEHIEVHYLLDKNSPTAKTIDTLVNSVISKRDESLNDFDHTLVIITKSKCSQSVNDSLSYLYKETGTYVQIFSIRTLMFNVTKHTLVPPHTRLEPSIFETHLKNEYHIKSPDQLPHIMDNDPVAKFIGLRPGDICKITRPSLSAGQHQVYRHCVSSTLG
jgi:DNA-directed RNA polymerase I, II, and III subunit RPABC1|tara:strand:- start:183 stop:854 length:672 start_codon:yes stop_codon:yes gene_type:complete